MAGRLGGKVAIITGGTSGFGERTAERFAQEGAKVVIAGRSEKEGQAIAQRIGANAVYQRTDVTEEADIQALVQNTVDRFGKIDCLFNNAGAGLQVFSIEEVTAEGIRQEMELLVSSVFLATKAVTPHLKRQRSGSIINNASIAGLRSGYAPLVYSAAKAAVIQLTRFVAAELAQYRIRVNSISPGAIVTPVFARIFGFEGERAREAGGIVRDWLSEFVPLGRAGETDDIAGAALFLASDDAAFLTGHDLVVDGGLTTGLSAQQSTQLYGKLTAALGVAGADSSKGGTAI
jgi:NAD(P)-dependent dehydrogenase (short-subunit alcohol dehydrogenase family)